MFRGDYRALRANGSGIWLAKLKIPRIIETTRKVRLLDCLGIGYSHHWCESACFLRLKENARHLHFTLGVITEDDGAEFLAGVLGCGVKVAGRRVPC